eukprot:TRINITY_DN37608_c0_g1_i1.p2 TRINITY_DN37608_c0_g1~~TRINITY_DN37608_c0_g1_i1.p2  ORF type:complete len:152 (+),score=37.35 TRINITY_DN37608_c0_g1_i1:43-498(+)
MDPTPVDDVAEEADGALQDREQLRAARTVTAQWRWESLLEDEGPAATEAAAPARPVAQEPSEEVTEDPVRRGVIRYVYLLLDMTDASRQPDYKPRRLEFLCEAARSFAEGFFSENPLAELGLMLLRSGGCEALSLVSSALAASEAMEQLWL